MVLQMGEHRLGTSMGPEVHWKEAPMSVRLMKALVEGSVAHWALSAKQEWEKETVVQMEEG